MLTFDDLILEITRRCNLRCAHCLRGEAQNVDIDPAAIDVLLDQTGKINNLLFSGGEPTLNISAIWHTLDGLERRRIPLHDVEVITNGVILSKELAAAMRAFSVYVTPWKKARQDSVTLSISSDRYHRGADAMKALRFYREELADVATVKLDKRGERPVKIGRASMLTDAVKPSIIGSYPHRVELLEFRKPCFCEYQSELPSPEPGEKIVCCPLHISAKGDITRFVSYEGEYNNEDQRRDRIICNLSPSTPEQDKDIDRAIAAYNQKFLSCRAVRDQEAKDQQAYYAAHPREHARDIIYGIETARSENRIKELTGGNQFAEDFLMQYEALVRLAAEYL